MNKIVLSGVSLAVGLGAGFLIPKSGTTPSQREASPATPTKSSASRGPTSGTPSGANAAGRGSGTGSAGDISYQDLLELSKGGYGDVPGREFLDAIEGLSLPQIATIWDEIQSKKNLPHQENFNLMRTLFSRWADLDREGAWKAAQMTKIHQQKTQALSIVLSHIAKTDPRAARELHASLDNKALQQATLWGISSALISNDPQEALEFLMEEGHPSWQMGQYQNLFSTWATKDPDAAIAALAELSPSNKQQAYQGIIQALSQKDPEEAFAFAETIKNQQWRSQAIQTIVSNLAMSDPDRALSYLDSLPRGQARQSALSTIASTLMSSDPSRAMSWIESLAPHERNTAIQDGFWSYIQGDKAASAKLLSSLAPNNRTAHLYSQLASQWVMEDPEAATLWLEGLPPGLARQQATNGVLQQWSQSDPEKAAQFLSREGVQRDASYQAGQIAANWIQTDKTAALAWFDSLEMNTRDRQNALSNLLSNWANTDPEASSAFAAKIEDKSSRNDAFGHVINSWANSDPLGAQSWIESNLQGAEKHKALGNLVQTLSHSDPQGAAELYDRFASNAPTDEQQNEWIQGARNITSQWAAADPESAKDWVLKMPAGELRTSSLSQLVDSWGNNDVTGAANFVLTLANGQDRDRAIARLIDDVRQAEPDSAFLWAESISDNAERENAVRNTIAHWKRDDPQAAREAVQSANISEKVRENLLKSIDKQ